MGKHESQKERKSGTAGRGSRRLIECGGVE